MDLSRLAKELYASQALRGFARRTAKELHLCPPLDAARAADALRRAKARLTCHYLHVRELAESVPGADVVVERLEAMHLADERRLELLYDQLPLAGGPDMPGIALFLALPGDRFRGPATFGARSVALLPAIEEHDDALYGPDSPLVYMSSRWKRAVRRLTQRDERLLPAVARFNELWARERWFTIAANEGMERPRLPKEFQATYFSDISRRQEPIDGWVDAFWGVQSGVRADFPIRGNNDTSPVLSVLLTSHVPDCIAPTTGYVSDLPPAEASRLWEMSRRRDFARYLDGLGQAATSLADVHSESFELLNAAIMLLLHYDRDGLMMTEPCTVGAVIARMRERAARKDAAHLITEHASCGRYADHEFTLGGTEFLLGALAANLYDRPRDVAPSCLVQVRAPGPGQPGCLDIRAFFPNWTMTRDDERMFLLRPLRRGGAHRGVGYYLSAQVVWRAAGRVAWYGFRPAPEVDTFQALFHMSIPLSLDARSVAR